MITTIEWFEEQVREIFIEKGWNPAGVDNWFFIIMISKYKEKKIIIERVSEGTYIATGVGEKYPEAFKDCLDKLRKVEGK